MPMVADVAAAVIGADTHRDTHTLCMLAPTGAGIADTEIDNTTTGYAIALEWITNHAPAGQVIIGVEGSRSYGIGLARALAAAGHQVTEISRVRRPDPRKGKSDQIDAHAIARAVLAADTATLPTPRADADREALRILLRARTDMTDAHTAATNRLKALLLTGDDTDRRLARGALTLTALTSLTRRRSHRGDDTATTTRRGELTRLARTLTRLHHDLTSNRKARTDILDQLTPELLHTTGIGPVTAAQAVVSWSHPGRVRDDAAFAALAGTCPIPASSGQTTRHRLNRGGDRDLNHAVYIIALTRWRTCPRTHDYITRRRAEGKTDREICRALKRYITREVHRKLTRAMT